MHRLKKNIWSLLFIFLFGVGYTLWQADLSPARVTAPTPIPQNLTTPPDWYAVYFTDPGREGFRGGPDAPMIAALDAAKLSIDIATYDFNLWGLRDALIAAHRRGVQVRVVIETSYLDNPEVVALIEAGIPMVDDRNNGLMHNKFIVIDRNQVWTGSMNFTINGAYRNDNNLLVIRDAAVAQTYLTEFDEMFTAKKFGSASPNGRGTSLSVAGTPVEIYFSPDDGVSSRIVSLINQAEESVYFMAFSFTSDPIAEAIIAQANAGLLVQGIFDESQMKSNTGGEYQNFVDAGVDVRIDGNAAKLHHKVIIIDGQIVITGSYNFSKSAETRNDENVLVFFDEAITRLFLDEWERVFELGN